MVMAHDGMRIKAIVADILFDIHSEGVDISDTSFAGFAIQHADNLPSDVISMTIRKASDIQPDALYKSQFTSPADKSLGDLASDWTLQILSDETLVITTKFTSRPTKAAQIRFKGSDATMLVEPTDPHAHSIPTYIFPLFNIFLSRLLLDRGGFIIHSSAVRTTDGKGLLFTAPSGTGKSTIANLFRQHAHATIIDDDLIAIRPPKNGQLHPTAYNIPTFKHPLTPLRTTINATYAIAQSPTNTLQPISSTSVAVAELLSNTIQQPLDRHSCDTIARNVWLSFKDTTTFHLGFTPTPDAVQLITSNTP